MTKEMLFQIFLAVKCRIYIYAAVLKICFYKIVACAISPLFAKSNIWIIQERGTDAQDNAWHLFRYIVNNKPDINVLFAIKRNSVEYNGNLKNYHSKTIEYGSFLYYMRLFNAEVYASTHYHTYMPSFHVHKILKNSWFDISAKKVFLQHGITHNTTKGLLYPELKVDLFISGAWNEYQLLESRFFHPKGVVKYTGLARFDNLHSFKTKRQILIMPTWRNKYAGYSDEMFMQTDFYKAYSEVLSSKILYNELKNNNYNLVFYNHFEFQKFNHLFEPFVTDRIKLAHFGEQSVQDLLKESDLLVTDFSSIYYDFIYMGKPVIFFLLNQVEFRKSQYGEDNDDVSEFGYDVETAEEVIECIIDRIKTNCILEDKYIQKRNKIFVRQDDKNCERIFDSIKRLLN